MSEITVYSLYSLSPLESEEFRDSCTRKQWNEQYLQSLTPWFRSADGRCLARLTRKRSPQDATGVGIVNTITRESNMPDQLQQWKKAEIDTNDPFIGYMTNEQVCYMMYNFIAPSSRIIQDPNTGSEDIICTLINHFQCFERWTNYLVLLSI